MLGFDNIPHRSGPLSLIQSYVDIFDNFHLVNVVAVGMSVICCAILLIFKFCINQMIQKRIKANIPFPIELILVIVGTTLSNFLQLNSSHSIQVVGKIPSGLPSPIQPDWNLVLLLARRSIPLAIVAYTLTISVGKIFANRYNYSIDPNQELIALGSTNILSSFFSCLPSAASLSRSAVQVRSLKKTQIIK